MLLYHGTSGSAGLKILKDGAIKIHQTSPYENAKDLKKGSETIKSTTDTNFIYFTNDLCKAIYSAYAAVSIINFKIKADEKEQYMYIFEVNIPEEELLFDYEQFKHINSGNSMNKNFDEKDYLNSLAITKCVRINHDIQLIKFCTRHLRVVSGDYVKDTKLLKSMENMMDKRRCPIEERSEETKSFFENFNWKEYL